ncbi:MAG TPA: DUF58 domain-containing protein [Chitinivibrionales bacterium]|nr:DUF58 domain-containing protein [Chitinivibrionales bacterium]
MSNQISFLKPEHLAPIRNLTLRTKAIVEGTIAGLHKSPYHGFSAQFLEYRPYLPGEAARRIDWRKYAKTGRSVVRLYEDETNLFAWLLLDKSASMTFNSTAAMSKFEYARTLAASLSWILVRQRDAVGLYAFDSGEHVMLPPRSTNTQLKAILTRLETMAPGGTTAIARSLSRLAETIRKRGLCIVISDLLDEPTAIITALRHLRFKRQDVMVLWVLDPLERAFSAAGGLDVRDLETGAGVAVDGLTASEYFSRGMLGHQKAIEDACRSLRIGFEPVVTSEPFQKALLRVLAKRRRLF